MPSDGACPMGSGKKAPKKAGFIKNLYQKFNPKPTKDAAVRFDGNAGLWAVLDKSMNPKQHFDLATMENVKFSKDNTKDYSGCGASTEYIGVATGDLYLHRGVENMAGAENISFGSNGFVRLDGTVIHSAKRLLLMSGRHAVAWL